jgi:hypothetical protein
MANRWKNLNSMKEIKKARDKAVLQAGSGQITPMEFDEKMDKLVMAEMRLRSIGHQKKHVRTSKYGKRFLAGRAKSRLRFISLLKQDFESSSGKTEQFKRFVRIFRNDFKKLLEVEFNATPIVFNVGHFEVSGFFRVPGQGSYELSKFQTGVFYFSIGDVRWDKDSMLIRTAQNFQDYTGGTNEYVRTDNEDVFIEDLKRVVSGIRGGKYFKIGGATYDSKSDSLSWEQDVTVQGPYGGSVEGSDEINVDAEDVINWAKKIKKIRKR